MPTMLISAERHIEDCVVRQTITGTCYWMPSRLIAEITLLLLAGPSQQAAAVHYLPLIYHSLCGNNIYAGSAARTADTVRGGGVGKTLTHCSTKYAPQRSFMVAVGHDGGSGRDTYIHAPAPIALPILGHALQAPKNATSHSTSRICRLTRMVLPAAAAGWQRSSVV